MATRHLRHSIAGLPSSTPRPRKARKRTPQLRPQPWGAIADDPKSLPHSDPTYPHFLECGYTHSLHTQSIRSDAARCCRLRQVPLHALFAALLRHAATAAQSRLRITPKLNAFGFSPLPPSMEPNLPDSVLPMWPDRSVTDVPGRTYRPALLDAPGLRLVKHNTPQATLNLLHLLPGHRTKLAASLGPY